MFLMFFVYFSSEIITDTGIAPANIAHEHTIPGIDNKAIPLIPFPLVQPLAIRLPTSKQIPPSKHCMIGIANFIKFGYIL